mgnify:CR=1 FL=1
MDDLPAHPDASPLAPDRYSPALAVTGLLMIAALFMAANPVFGIREQRWPWEFLAQGHHSLPVVVALFLWTAAGFWCLAMPFSGATRVRALGAAILGAPLLIEACGGTAGLRIEHYNLNKMVPMILLGGGLLVAREPLTRASGSILAGAGGLLLVWALATGFPEKGTQAQLVVFVQELGTVLTDPTHEFERPNHLWWQILPQTLVLLGAVGGILALLGLRARSVLAVAFWILLAGLFAPGVVGSTLYLLEGAGINAVIDQVFAVFIAHGALLWMLGVFAIQDFGKARALAEAA